MAFNPNEHMRQLKSKEGSQDYLDVKWRLVWFREQCPLGTIDTEELAYDTEREVQAEVWQWNTDTRRSEKVVKHARGYARYRAVVTDGKGARATGTKDENAANFAEYGPKAETGAVGRALAMLGYGTQFTGDELAEHDRFADAPVDRSQGTTGQSTNRQPIIASVRTASPPTTVQEGLNEAARSEQQVTSIRTLCTRLGKPEPEHMDTMTYKDAKALITRMSHEYNESKQSRKYDTANAAKREVTNLPLAPQKLTELKVAFAVAFLVPSDDVNERFARWVGLKLQGAVTVETLMEAHYKPLLKLIDAEAQEGAVS